MSDDGEGIVAIAIILVLIAIGALLGWLTVPEGCRDPDVYAVHRVHGACPSGTTQQAEVCVCKRSE